MRHPLRLLVPLLVSATIPTPTAEPEPAGVGASDLSDTGLNATGFNPSGQDADGRIPLQPLPAGIDERDRWRYLPPARMKVGSFIDRFGVTSYAFPIVFSEEAIGTGVGAGIVDTDFRNRGRAEIAVAFASITTEGQQQYVAAWRRNLHQVPEPRGGVFQRENANLGLQAGYSRTLTRRFFGFGPRSRFDDQTSYTDEAVESEAELQGHPLPGAAAVVGVIGLRIERHRLGRGRVAEHPTTPETYPDLVARADGVTSGVLRTGLAWDGRDSSANPYRGFTLGIDVDWRIDDRSHGIGAVVGGRASWIVPIPSLFHDSGAADLAAKGPEENPPTDVIAVGVLVQDSRGDLPFYALPSLGGPNTLRGDLEGRYTDRAAWHASAEWRTWIMPRGFHIAGDARIERLGLAPFIDLGTVAPRLGDLPDARIHRSIGLGLRFCFERAVVLRLDVARSEDQTGVNFTAGMAF